jgi:hypothetical protein
MFNTKNKYLIKIIIIQKVMFTKKGNINIQN